MKFLLIPENNSLSHITKCLSIMEILESHGHEAHIAVSKKHSCFLTNLGINHHLLSDIQETDSEGFPTFKWFSNTDIITNCIQEEVDLINKIQPDKILGVFRFTLYASSQIVKIPFDSLICGCMIPDSQEVLGFSKNEAGIKLQKIFMDNFFRFAGKKLSLVLKKFGLTEIDDVRFALKGNHTFLWDFPEFMPIQKRLNTIHVGPISLNLWPYDPINMDHIIKNNKPLAVISFGTCITNNEIILRLARLLLNLDYQVIVAAGGQEETLNIRNLEPRVTVLKYAPLNKIFPYTSLLITHGGQMTVFEALQNQIPVLVMPLQPEQAHNGICLERIGCGCRLIPSTHFTGFPDDYIKAFHRISDAELKNIIISLTSTTKTQRNLTAMKEIIDRYHGAHTLVNYLEEK